MKSGTTDIKQIELMSNEFDQYFVEQCKLHNTDAMTVTSVVVARLFVLADAIGEKGRLQNLLKTVSELE
jgi:hypothetical protein